MNLPPLNPLPKTTKKKKESLVTILIRKIKVFNNDAESLQKKKPTKKRKFIRKWNLMKKKDSLI